MGKKAAKKQLNPYDCTIEDNLSMYNHLPYERDADLCNRDSLGLVSGNVLKSYQYKGQSPYTVHNMDDVITYKIAKDSHPSYEDSLESDDEISMEAVEQLLTSQSDMETEVAEEKA